MRHTYLTTVVVLTCTVLVGWSQAQTGPKIISVDVPGASGTEAIFINPSGVITGVYADWNGANHGFVRSADGTMTSFDASGAGTGPGEGTEPWSINPTGDITGWYTDATGFTHGFLRTANGSFTTFDVPGAAKPAGIPCTPPVICSNGTQGGAINAAGEITGQYLDAAGVFHGFVRSPEGTITTFDVPGAGTGFGQGTYVVFGDGISLSGAVVGGYQLPDGTFHDFVRSPDGAITTFDPFGSGFPQTAGINSRGVTMGLYVGATGSYHGFVHSPDGELTSFDVSGAGTAAGQGTEGFNINMAGDITGTYIDGSGVGHGFLRLKDGTVSTFDAPGAGTSSGQGTTPFSNNPANAIVGFYVDVNGVYHGFLRQ